MATKNTHTAVHSIQFYDTKTKSNVEIKAGSDFNPNNLNADIDMDRLLKGGAVKKIDAKASAQGTNAPAPAGDEDEDEFDTLLDANVGDVTDAIYAEERNADWLATLRAREVKGKNRTTVLEAIDSYEVDGE